MFNLVSTLISLKYRELLIVGMKMEGEEEEAKCNLGEATGAQVLQQERTRMPDRSVPVV